MEEKFIDAWLDCRKKAEAAGVRLRSLERKDALVQAHRALSGSRESDGFSQLMAKGLLKYSLEALAVDKRFTLLFSDEEANNALSRLMDAGYYL